MTAKLRQHSLSSVRKLQELLHDCNLQLAAYRNAVQGIGTSADGVALRKEIDACARACVRSCESTKNCVLPQLRHDGELSVEFTKHASQFIGCVSACVVEMKRCTAMEATFPITNFAGNTSAGPSTSGTGVPSGTPTVVPTTSGQTPSNPEISGQNNSGVPGGITTNTTGNGNGGATTSGTGTSSSIIQQIVPTTSEQHIIEMEQMLETLENLITVHFSTTETNPTDKVTPRRRRGASCRPQCVCSKLKTSYA
uniref:CPG4 domain-containing protein n=1 Tax=Strongyloides papillosus TaxID=174720 RepID=A0A0N5BUL0_STREA